MSNVKYDTNELIYKTEINSKAWKKKFTVTKSERGWGRDKFGIWN